MAGYHVNNCDCPVGNCDCDTTYYPELERFIYIKGIRFAVRFRNKKFYMEEICLNEKSALDLALFILDSVSEEQL